VHVFDAFYPVHGVIDDGGCPTPNPLVGKKVVFYQSFPTYVADEVINPANGEYAVNIFDNIQLEIDPTTTYYVAVEKAADGWGADPVEVRITSEGWNKVDLTLALGAGPGGTTEGPDDGDINETTIERTSGGNVELTWNFNSAGVTQVDVWRHDAGAQGEFVADPNLYSIVLTGNSGTSWVDGGVNVGDGLNYYYRVVPAGTVQANIFNGTFNKRTMGKVDVRLRDEYTAISYPFNAAYIDVLTLMGEQLDEGDQIHWWDQPGQQYSLITKLVGGWPNTHSFQFAEGFFVYLVPGSIARDMNLTLVGLVGNFASSISIPMDTEYKLMGYPYPVARDAKQIGLRELESDQIHVWLWNGQQFTMTTYVSDWNNLTLIDFGLGESKFWYTPDTNITYDWVPIF
jgi:hypothetical protein